jgi:ATP-dependent DNA helicase RecQ
MDVLYYLPQTDKPQVTFLSERIAMKDVWVDKPYLEQRKKVFRQKMEAMFNYAEARQCRSQLLLAYFDEHNAHKCGICDVCLDEKRKASGFDTTDKITDEIAENLSTNKMSLDTLVRSVSAGNEKERIAVIRLLLDAGKIKSDGEHYYL